MTDNPTIEERYELEQSPDYEHSYTVPSPEEVNSKVAVVQTPSMFLVELSLSKKGDETFGITRYYTPAEAEQLADTLTGNESSSLTKLLPLDHSNQLAHNLEIGARIAGIKAVGEVVGEDVMSAFKEGAVTPDEFMHEYSREVDKMIDERDSLESGE